MVESLNKFLNKSLSYCLNEDALYSHGNLFDGSNEPLKSNADEQLLLHLSLIQTVKLTSIILSFAEDSSCPGTISLFANKTNMGFNEATGFIISYCGL
jgi:hypothetical protein